MDVERIFRRRRQKEDSVWNEIRFAEILNLSILALILISVKIPKEMRLPLVLLVSAVLCTSCLCKWDCYKHLRSAGKLSRISDEMDKLCEE